MLITVVPKQERPEEWIYQEKKTPKQFMITQSSSDEIDQIARHLGISRSEVVERAIKCGGIEKAGKFNPETGKCNIDILPASETRDS